MTEKKEFDFFDKQKNIKLLWILLYAVCGLLLIPEFFLHREPHFRFDSFWGFFAILGFVTCAILILFSKLIGFVLKVKENYYD